VAPVATPSSDDQRHGAAQVEGRPGAPVGLLAAPHLGQLAPDLVLDGGARHAQLRHDVLVQDDAAAGDRAHRQLLVARHAQLAHHEHVEGGAQRAGHLERDGDAAARQAEHQEAGSAGVLPQVLGQLAPRVRTVGEEHLAPP